MEIIKGLCSVSGFFHAVDDGEKRVVSYLGPELIGAWNTAAFWNTFWNWSEAGPNLSINGVDGMLVKNNFWVIGNKYRCEFTINITGGGIYGPYGLNIGAILVFSNNYVYEYVSDSVGMSIYAGLMTGDIVGLSVKEIIKKEVDE